MRWPGTADQQVAASGKATEARNHSLFESAFANGGIPVQYLRKHYPVTSDIRLLIEQAGRAIGAMQKFATGDAGTVGGAAALHRRCSFCLPFVLNCPLVPVCY